MGCQANDWLSNSQFRDQFSNKIAHSRVPFSGSIELTYRCNFRCVHCYIDEGRRVSLSQDSELSTEKWKNIIDEITEAGCLYLLISGGDPLLREDFCEIYAHAKRQGLIVSIFTNGTNLNKEIVDTFKKYPPRIVEITLYGASKSTYKKITGCGSGFNTCIMTIERLQEAGIIIGLKTVLLTLNMQEYYQMEDIARHYGVDFRYDSAIMPKFDGDPTPLRLRVNPQDVVKLDFEDNKRALEWLKLGEKLNNANTSDKLYTCGCGLTSFHISPSGNLQPCMMVEDVFFNLQNDPFLEGWLNVIPQIRSKKSSCDNVCSTCEKTMLCSYCPSFSYLETGDKNVRSDYLCSIAQLRSNEIYRRMKNHETS